MFVGSWLENAGGTVKKRSKVQTNFQSVAFPFKSMLYINSSSMITAPDPHAGKIR